MDSSPSPSFWFPANYRRQPAPRSRSFSLSLNGYIQQPSLFSEIYHRRYPLSPATFNLVGKSTASCDCFQPQTLNPSPSISLSNPRDLTANPPPLLPRLHLRRELAIGSRLLNGQPLSYFFSMAARGCFLSSAISHCFCFSAQLLAVPLLPSFLRIRRRYRRLSLPPLLDLTRAAADGASARLLPSPLPLAKKKRGKNTLQTHTELYHLSKSVSNCKIPN